MMYNVYTIDTMHEDQILYDYMHAVCIINTWCSRYSYISSEEGVNRVHTTFSITHDMHFMHIYLSSILSFECGGASVGSFSGRVYTMTLQQIYHSIVVICIQSAKRSGL